MWGLDRTSGHSYENVNADGTRHDGDRAEGMGTHSSCSNFLASTARFSCPCCPVGVLVGMGTGSRATAGPRHRGHSRRRPISVCPLPCTRLMHGLQERGGEGLEWAKGPGKGEGEAVGPEHNGLKFR